MRSTKPIQRISEQRRSTTTQQQQQSYDPELGPAALLSRNLPPDEKQRYMNAAEPELTKQSAAWVTGELIPGTFTHATYQTEDKISRVTVSFGYSTRDSFGNVNPGFAGFIFDGGVLGSVCYRQLRSAGAHPDDPFLAYMINGGSEHVFPDRADGRLAPCYPVGSVTRHRFSGHNTSEPSMPPATLNSATRLLKVSCTRNPKAASRQRLKTTNSEDWGAIS
jgi:hypothetical protein